jgi:hypothetical protein
MDDMMTKIVNAAAGRLKSNMKNVTEFDIAKDFANIISYPSIAVVIEKIGIESGAEMMSGNEYVLRPVLSVYMVFKAVQPGPRREGIYPLVAAAAALLVGQTLGLDIEPLEPDGPITEIVNEAIVKTGSAAFVMRLKSGFVLDTSEDGGEMERLLVTANEYGYRMWKSGTQVIEHVNDREDIDDSEG